MLSQIEQVFLFLMIFFIMFGVGSSLVKKDFEEVLTIKKAWGIGMISQFLLMPLLGFLIVSLFHFPDEIIIGILVISSSPGGSTSNLFTYFSRGQTALSIVMTVTSTIGSFALMPLSLWFYLKYLKNIDVIIPYKNILISLAMVITPVAIGFLVRLKRPKAAALLEKLAQYCGLAVIFVMIIIWIPRVVGGLDIDSLPKYISVVGLNLGGIFAGFLISKCFGLSTKASRAVMFETGIQNAPLAFAIVLLSFPDDKSALIGEVPLLYGAVSVGVGILFTIIFRVQSRPVA